MTETTDASTAVDSSAVDTASLQAGTTQIDAPALLDALSAKTRVHELAKRFGLSSRVLLQTLADQGVQVTSSSSSVDAAAARAALITLIDLTPSGAVSDGGSGSGSGSESESGPEQEPEPTGDAGALADTPTAPDSELVDDLPARLRVHELAKRAGVSARQMIELLVRHGVTAKSAQSVIARAVAAEVLASLDTQSAAAHVGTDAVVFGDADTGGSADEAEGPDDGGRGRRRRSRGRPTTDAENADAVNADTENADVVNADTENADAENADAAGGIGDESDTDGTDGSDRRQHRRHRRHRQHRRQ